MEQPWVLTFSEELSPVQIAATLKALASYIERTSRIPGVHWVRNEGRLELCTEESGAAPTGDLAQMIDTALEDECANHNQEWCVCPYCCELRQRSKD